MRSHGGGRRARAGSVHAACAPWCSCPLSRAPALPCRPGAGADAPACGWLHPKPYIRLLLLRGRRGHAGALHRRGHQHAVGGAGHLPVHVRAPAVPRCAVCCPGSTHHSFLAALLSRWPTHLAPALLPARRPGGETVPKALHVSPLMDMRATWYVSPCAAAAAVRLCLRALRPRRCAAPIPAAKPSRRPRSLPRRRLRATAPGDRLFLSVGCTHPEYGDFFLATFDARPSAHPHLPNETASLRTLWRCVGQPGRSRWRAGRDAARPRPRLHGWPTRPALPRRPCRYGFQPQRVAVWIYWHAVLLLAKGVPFFGCVRGLRGRQAAGAVAGWLATPLRAPPRALLSPPPNPTLPCAALRAAPPRPSSRRRRWRRRTTPRWQTAAASCGAARSSGRGGRERAGERIRGILNEHAFCNLREECAQRRAQGEGARCGGDVACSGEV